LHDTKDFAVQEDAMTARTLVSTFSGIAGPGRSRDVDIARVWRVVVTRAELADVETRMLRDVGLSREDARAEQQRAPWDTAPRHPYRRRKQPKPPFPSSRTEAARAWLRDAWRRHRSRQMLAGMDAATLRDVGLTYAEAEMEANKPFWRA
jgi:uncharacterized protein YjiS (DUF1127 family)